jgi:hypothetical protein
MKRSATAGGATWRKPIPTASPSRAPGATDPGNAPRASLGHTTGRRCAGGAGRPQSRAQPTDSLAIRDRLAKSDPGNAGWQRDLSGGYAKLADAYSKSNETAKVRDALAAGRAIIGKLVEQHPDQAQWKQDLAWFDARIAERGKTSPKKKPMR